MNYPIEETVVHVRFLARQFSKCDARFVIIIILLELDVPTKYDGFDYLLNAIKLYFEDPAQMITKGLYAAVANLYGGRVDASHVESSIRAAIKEAWKRKNVDAWNLYFLFGGDRGMKRPSNTEFISRIARIVQVWKGCCQAFERTVDEREVTV